jgi:hypothetical protein
MLILPSIECISWHIWMKITGKDSNLSPCCFGFDYFVKVHLLGSAGLPIWGIWNKSFFELGADAISWSILALTAGVGMAAAYVLGRLSATTVLQK